MKRLILLVIILSLIEVTAWAGQGWYLMIPPIKSAFPMSDIEKYKETLYPDPDQPISKWQTFRVFDTAKECDSEMQRIYAQGWALKDSKKQKDIEKFISWTSVVCVASDDPRLK